MTLPLSDDRSSCGGSMVIKNLFLLTFFLSFHAQATITDFDATSIWRYALSHGIQSVDDLLPEFPAAYRDRYLAVYQSRSLQDASPKNPRIILVGGEKTTN